LKKQSLKPFLVQGLKPGGFKLMGQLDDFSLYSPRRAAGRLAPGGDAERLEVVVV
jgi:hypothetical protein